jgi:glycosyltransferase involved in cell wall biosynthesis
LRNAIVRLLDDEELRVRCATRGRSEIASRFGLERATNAAVDVVDAVVANEPRPVPITWIVPDFTPGSGGTSRQTATVAGGLRARGHRVRIVARYRSPSLRRREIYEGLRVRRMGMTGSGVIAEKLSILMIMFRLARPSSRRDVVQVLMYPDFAVSAYLAGRSRWTVMTWAGLGDASDSLAPSGGLARQLQHLLRRRAVRRAVNTALTPALCRELESLGFESDVLPLPVDPIQFRSPTRVEREHARHRFGITEPEFVVVYTGQLRRLKAIDQLIEAFALLAETGRKCHLFVVGGAGGTDDTCADELVSQARRLALGDAVTFTGPVSDVRAYLWASDAFVLPSEREGMPNSLLEAMASGLACVVPEKPVGRDVVGDAGIVTADNRAESLLPALMDLADDAERRHALGIAAMAAIENYTLETVLDRQEHVYDRVIERVR